MSMRNIKGSKGCITGLTPVMMEDLSEKFADELRVGDRVLAFNPAGDLLPAHVFKIDEHKDEEVWEYDFWGRKLLCTPSHWVQNQFGAFVEVGSLTFEDAVINVDGHLLPLTHKRLLGKMTVYEIHVTPYATLIGNKLRIHNGGLGLAPHIKGKKGGGKGGGGTTTFQEDPNTLRSKSVARVLDLIGEGEIVGLVDGARSIFLDDTPLQNADGTYNFEGVKFEQRFGTPGQDYIAGFAAAEAELTVDTEITKASPVVRTIVDSNLDALNIKIRIPQLTKSDTKTGSLYGSEVKIAIDVQPNGGSYTEVRTDTITGKTISPYERSYRVALPAGGAPWNVRVRRITDDSDTATVQDKTYWPTYTAITDAKLSYPDSALVAVTVDAEKFGSRVPRRAYRVRGRIISVPSNYDPETREYDGIWDGTFQLAYSNNPAWVLYDVLSNNRYGLGENIQESQIDKWALYTIGQYCDELVPDGFGGMEPRFTINIVLNTREQAYSVVNAIASAFRGMVYWSSGAITASQDAPGDIVKLVTPSNVIGGQFNYSGSSLKARHNAVLVTWNDPADISRTAIELVEDAESIARYGWRQADVVAIGCNSRGQANRLGRWLLDSEKNETEMVSYKASFDHADVRPGQLIGIMDPLLMGARMGGRIKSVTSTTVFEVDELPSNMTPNETYYVSATLPDGKVETVEVLSWAGNEITTNVAFSVEPEVNAQWLLSSTSVAPRTFRVLANTEVGENQFEITAIFHDSTKYARVEQGVQFDTTPFLVIREGRLASPTAMAVEEYLYQAGPAVKSALAVSFTPSSDPRAYLYEIQVQAPGETAYAPMGFIQSNTFDLKDTQPGTYLVRVRTLDIANNTSQWFEQSFAVLGLLAPPSNVTGFFLDVNNGQVFLRWRPVPDLDVAAYVIKFTPDLENPSWVNAQIISNNITRDTLSVTFPAQRGTYLIKAIDTSGVESLEARMATNAIASIQQTNIIETAQQEPSWPGTTDGTEVQDEMLLLSSVNTMADWETLDDVLTLYFGVDGIVAEGIYYAPIFDLGAKYPVRINAQIIADALNLLNVMSTWTTLGSLIAMEPTEYSEWEVETQIAVSDDGVTWSDWQLLQIGEYEGRYFQPRAVLRSFNTAVAARLKSMIVVYDMPDRVADGRGIVCPPGGMTVTYSPAFKAPPTLGVDVDDLAADERKVISNKTQEGFDIEFFDASNTSITKTFDYLAKGYGLRTS